MGEISEALINGEFDSITGEYIGEGNGYPSNYDGAPDDEGLMNLARKAWWKHSTPAEKKIASIRKEIAQLVNSGVDLKQARKLMNSKYGKGWRERGLISNDDNQWTEEDLKPFQNIKSKR